MIYPVGCRSSVSKSGTGARADAAVKNADDKRDIYNVVDTSQVPGVGEITVSAAGQPAVRIPLNPTAIGGGIATDNVRLTVIINANPLGP